MMMSRGAFAATFSVCATFVCIEWLFAQSGKSVVEPQAGGAPGSSDSAVAALTEAGWTVAAILVASVVSLAAQGCWKRKAVERRQLAKLAPNKTSSTVEEFEDAPQEVSPSQRPSSPRAGRSTAEVRANQQLVHCLRNCLATSRFQEGLANFDRVVDSIGAGCKTVWSMVLYCALEAKECWRCEDFIWQLLEVGDLNGNDFVNMVRYYVNSGDAVGLTAVLCAVSRLAYEPDLVTRNRALAVCQAAGAAQMAEVLTDGTSAVKLDVVAYNTLIRLYGTCGDLTRCKELVEEMKAASLKPTEMTFGIMIDVCVKNKDVEGASQAFEEVARSGLEPNVVHYTTFIQGLVLAQLYDEAERLLDEMVLRGHSTPDVVMYATLMKAFSDQGAINPAIRLLKRMLKQGIEPDIMMFNTALNACSVKAMKPEDVVSVFDSFVELGLRPNTVTLSATIKALVRARGHTQATELLRSFPTRFGYKPAPRVFEQLVLACQAAGHSQEAEQVEALAREQCSCTARG